MGQGKKRARGVSPGLVWVVAGQNADSVGCPSQSKDGPFPKRGSALDISRTAVHSLDNVPGRSMRSKHAFLAIA